MGRQNFFPGRHPVLIFNDPEFRFRNLGDAAQMPQRLADLRFLFLNLVIHRQITVNVAGTEGSTDILGIIIVHAAFHNYAVFREAGEYFRNCFGNLIIDGQTDLEPAFLILH